MIKKWIVNNLLAYLKQYLTDHADELAQKGLDYALQLIAIIEAKLNGEELFALADEALEQFAAGADEVIASCPADAE